MLEDVSVTAVGAAPPAVQKQPCVQEKHDRKGLKVGFGHHYV